MTTHKLKTWPRFFDAIASGAKTYEVRLDDRGFQKGDAVVLEEWDPDTFCSCRDRDIQHPADCPRYSGRSIEATIGHVTSSTPRRGSTAGFDGRGYVVFSLLIEGVQADPVAAQ